MAIIHFFELVKKNTLLYSILINGNFSQINFESPNIVVWSEKAIQINDVVIGQDRFESVTIILFESFISLDLKSKDQKFFVNPHAYFGKDVPIRTKIPYYMGADLIEEQYKDLGIYTTSHGPVSIILRQNSILGNVISIKLYSEGIEHKNLTRPTFYINGLNVSQEVLSLFKVDEIVLTPTFTPVDYAPRIEIFVKNPQHPILKYFAKKASILLGNKIYEHGVIPKITPSQICGLTYLEEANEQDTLTIKSMLKIEICNELKETTNIVGSIEYEVISPEVNYFKIGTRILTRTEVDQAGINLEDYTLVDTIFGKEAVDKFKSPEFYSGVSIYKARR